LDPAHVDAHLDLRGLLLEKGELTEAREHFAKASKRNPKLAQPHNYLGKVLMHEGNTSQAVHNSKKRYASVRIFERWNRTCALPKGLALSFLDVILPEFSAIR
jgi:tetratricopeptide (TPR) repeat protein